MWCESCAKQCQTGKDNDTGIVSCVECGRVLMQEIYTEEPSFVKGAGGESRLAGNYVKSIQRDYSESLQRTLDKGYDEIHHQMVQLTSGNGNDSIERKASRFYEIAVKRHFTRGRRTELVAASCLYIACRANEEPYLLIDFSKELSVNVYVLGAVFLQLCKLLSLQEHEFVQKLIDPSLFMHRFTSRLIEDDLREIVEMTALNIVSSMKRDWMQTGRKPSGICGAALYISALSHGLTCSRSDILKIVHICEATLTKRLIEFEGTTSGSLTIEELNQKAEEYKNEKRSKMVSRVGLKGNETAEVLCKHAGEEPCFAHGLCRNCYEEFLDISGGLDGEAQPPAFQRAEMYRLTNASTSQDTDNIANASDVFDEAIHKTNGNVEDTLHPGSIAAEMPEMHYISTSERSTDDPNLIDEDNLSDIDDVEVNLYLHSEEESRFKKIIWEEMNKEYIEEQAAKEAAAAAAAAAAFKSYGDNPDDARKAQEFAAATAAAVAETREKKRQKRALDAKNAVPPKTAVEAAKRMVGTKGFRSRINYEEFDKLFEESDETPVLKDDIRKEKRKDRDDDNDNDEEEYEEDMSENVENNVADKWDGGEETMYNYDDYDPDNYEGEY